MFFALLIIVLSVSSFSVFLSTKLTSKIVEERLLRSATQVVPSKDSSPGPLNPSRSSQVVPKTLDHSQFIRVITEVSTKELNQIRFEAQIGDILLKLAYNLRNGSVNGTQLAKIQSSGDLFLFAQAVGIPGTTRVAAERVEAAFCLDHSFLKFYLDYIGVPTSTHSSFVLSL